MESLPSQCHQPDSKGEYVVFPTTAVDIQMEQLRVLGMRKGNGMQDVANADTAAFLSW